MSDKTFADKIKRVISSVDKESKDFEKKVFQTRTAAIPVMAEAQARKERMMASFNIEREKANEAILYAIKLAELGTSSALLVPNMGGVFYLKKLFSKTKEVQELEVIKHRDDGVDFSNNTTIRFMPKTMESNAAIILGTDPLGKKRDYKILDVNDFHGDPDMEVFAEVFGWD